MQAIPVTSTAPAHTITTMSPQHMSPQQMPGR